jgi:hypothetical protein
VWSAILDPARLGPGQLRTQKEANSTARAGLAELLRRFTAGEFDLMSVGRGQIADAEWVHTVRDGRFSDIRPFVVPTSGRRPSRDQPSPSAGQPLTQPMSCNSVATVRLLLTGGCYGFS